MKLWSRHVKSVEEIRLKRTYRFCRKCHLFVKNYKHGDHMRFRDYDLYLPVFLVNPATACPEPGVYSKFSGTNYPLFIYRIYLYIFQINNLSFYLKFSNPNDSIARIHQVH
jgi:hypothetical protein